MKIKKLFWRINDLMKKKGLFYVILVGAKQISSNLHPKMIYYSLKSNNGKIIKTILGSKMILDLNDKGLSRQLLLRGIREEEATKQLTKSLKEGMVCLEVGSNIGYFLLIESKLVGSKGKIYALEPDPRSFKILRENVKLNNIEDNIQLYNFAAGNKNGKEKFMLSKYYNSSNMTNYDAGSTGDYIDVEVRKLDDLFKKEKIDFIRMDSEGYEFEILKGAKNILKNVKFMFIEVHPKILRKSGIDPLEFYKWVFDQGFDVKIAFGSDSKTKRKKMCKSKEDILNSVFDYGHVFFEKKK
ncbi:MAG: FkbM family methyltransferase [Candidatus Pacearchaeota archaeon]